MTSFHISFGNELMSCYSCRAFSFSKCQLKGKPGSDNQLASAPVTSGFKLAPAEAPTAQVQRRKRQFHACVLACRISCITTPKPPTLAVFMIT
jgi:hypothetical protein